ncbi:MAG TPA: hypothetical protein PK909_01265 [Sphaerochaeta sp.]|nr:hypothetical protein [Sphaerochaeta sp.]HQB54076.1 hypothetical protein [Sphaerochaeta sp.]
MLIQMLAVLKILMLLLVGGISILNRFYIGVGLYYSMILLLIVVALLYWRLAFHLSVKETKIIDPIRLTRSSSKITEEELVKGRIVFTEDTFYFFVKEKGRVVKDLAIPLDHILDLSTDSIVESKKALVITTSDASYAFTMSKDTLFELPQTGNMIDR